MSSVSVCGLIFLYLFNAVVGQTVPHEFTQVKELPADVPTCSQASLNLNECLKSAFQEMMPRMKNGIKELNIPPLDPFTIEKSSYQYNTGIVQGRIALRNVQVYGMSESVIDKVDLDMKDGRVRMEVVSHIPRVFVEGVYKADMKLNDVKMTPKGYFNLTMTDVSVRALPEGELYEHNDHTYLKLTKFFADPEVGDMRIYASGLLPDPALNNVILDFVNQYWRPIYKAMLPETRATWEPLLIKAANEFLASVPFDLFVKTN